ncbi:MAG: RnfH family protein [Thiomicrospira sp.]|uniref:RnfH family protein n=1 Tax=Thiomicrospira sp. TaxID=935 RepID=UPI0019E9E815|nr:RnfH family protein [Thiomicrospira sp.]MBE0494735.1 RnfH family protein [Thiomicrospira sp.]
MNEVELINVEVAYALPEQQYLFALQVPQGTTAEQSIGLSPLFKKQPDVVVEQVGIFSRPVPKDTPLREGDRVEVYRPLKADPRERRRKQVETQRAESS